MDKTSKNLDDICFPVPQNFSLNVPAHIDSNEKVKRHIFQQTLQTAYKISIPSNFTSSYCREEPHQLVSDEQIETVVSLFQALQPQDALEIALSQQFIVIHIQAMISAKTGLSDRDLKKFELSHQIIETLMKYRNKGSQQIQVNYNHNQGQINHIKVVESGKQLETIEVKNEL